MLNYSVPDAAPPISVSSVTPLCSSVLFQPRENPDQGPSQAHTLFFRTVQPHVR